MQENKPEIQSEVEENIELMKSTKQYQTLKEKAQEYRSSGSAMLFVGLLGIIFIILNSTGIISVSYVENNKIMFYCVMGTLFVVFTVFGVISLKKAKIYFAESKTEDATVHKLEKWLQEIVYQQEMPEELNVNDCSQEQLYYNRIESLKDMIFKEFPDLDEIFVDDFIDKNYDFIFQSK